MLSRGRGKCHRNGSSVPDGSDRWIGQKVLFGAPRCADYEFTSPSEGRIKLMAHPGCRRGGVAMATYISLLNFTDQGIRNIKDSPDRFGAFRATAEKLGVNVKGFYYTVGHHDMVVILEGSDEAVAT